jgi:hypothetical protein
MANSPFNVAFRTLLGPFYNALRSYTRSDIRATRHKEAERGGRYRPYLAPSSWIGVGWADES